MVVSRPPHQSIYLEALEPRIAPAGVDLVIGPLTYDNNVSTGAATYTSDGTPFQEAASNPQFADLSFGPHHYYLDLKQGSVVDVKAKNQSQNTSDFINLSKGSAFAFFYDSNEDGIPTISELSGLSVSGGAVLAVRGSVDGDVVANRDGATGAFVSDSLISTKQSIGGLIATGNIGRDQGSDGRIIAGGNISGIDVGKVSIIQSGTPDGPVVYSFGGSGSVGGVGEIKTFDAGKQGGSLSRITVDSADALLAGPGGSGGGKGGLVTGVVVIADFDGIEIRGGAGGLGPRGGDGGAVSKIVFQGTSDSSDGGQIRINGGDAGASSLLAGGVGGKGGAISDIWVGYSQVVGANKKVSIVESPAPILNNIEIVGGHGGSGSVAGSGGSLTRVNIFASPTEDGTTETLLAGGNGGLVIGDARSAGAGGSVSLFKVKNIDLSSDSSETRVQGGDASAFGAGVTSVANGANGGKISNPGKNTKPSEEWLIGSAFEMIGGDGSDGAKNGGAGGDVLGLSFQPVGVLVPRSLDLVAGAGGDATTGRAGKGGAIDWVYLPDSDLDHLRIVSGDGGRGGSVGGVGGNISRVDIYDNDREPDPAAFTATVVAGAGGAASKSGGNGGSVSSFNLYSTVAAVDMRAGHGGSATGSVAGNGGRGGSLGGVVTLIGFPNPTDVFLERTARQVELAQTTGVSLIAGNGGDGKLGGAGGIGGSALSVINLVTPGSISVVGGDGGRAEGSGKTGSGGSVGANKPPARVSSALTGGGLAATALLGNVELKAGAGGASADPLLAKSGGNGGSIANVAAAAYSGANLPGLDSGNMSFEAGRGADGVKAGRGGNLINIGFYGSAGEDSAPIGDVALTAGRGGDAPAARGAGGAGGSISGADGLTSLDAVNLANNPATWDVLQARAGDGGSGGATGGAGGAISRVSLSDGLAPFSFVAGEGGDGGRTGGVGGSVLNISSAVRNIALAIAAGDGGDVTTGSRGAVGGSVDRINVFGDIGIRQGKAYGFATDGSAMGGIFAGEGGTGAVSTAAAGKVTNVTAQGIAAIVAGRGPSPMLASFVDGILLGGNKAAVQTSTGQLPNYADSTSVYAGNGTPTGGPGGGVNVNVMGDGSSLIVNGNSNGDLEFRLKTGGGVFDGVAVVYIDSRTGGITSTENISVLTPRNALNSSVIGSSLQPLNPYRSVLEFDPGFAPDYALAFSADFGASLYRFAGSTLVEVASAASAPTETSPGIWAVSIDFDDLGLPSTVASQFKFAASYMAGDVILNQVPAVQSVGGYRTNQAVGFGIGSGNPGSAQVPPAVLYPVTPVTTHVVFTQQLANIVGGKAGDPLAAGAANFHYINGAYQPSNTPVVWNYGTDRPLDGLIAAAKLGTKRNFEVSAFLTEASGSTAMLYLTPLEPAKP